MSKYIKVTETETVYPYHLHMLVADHPNTGFPSEPSAECLAEFGVYPVAATTPPTGDVVTEAAPKLIKGAWAQQWETRSYTGEESRAKWKKERTAAVAAITVTTAAGNTFDGDEVSQGRIARAIIALSVAPENSTVNWVLADDSAIDATSAELSEALLLAGAQQAALWVQPA